MTFVAVCGKGRLCPRPILELAESVGTLLAALPGVTVVTGGLGGVMEAAARGAFTHGAQTLSLIPAGREADAHPYTLLALRTGMPEPWRNVLLASMVDAAVICPGSHGTLQEAAILIDRGIPVVYAGDHFGWLSEALPLPGDNDPVDAVAVLARALDALVT